MKKLIAVLFLILCINAVTSNVFAASEQSVYGLSSWKSGEDVYTVDKNEYNALVKQGWNSWGEVWKAPTTGDPVYRLWNPSSGKHLYTLDQNEVAVLTTQHGWVSDNGGKPVFYSGGTVPVYRIYSNGMHYFTTRISEYNRFAKIPYAQEGIKLYGTYTKFKD